MSTDPHGPLRENVKLLGNALGEVLRLIEGESVYQTVEEVRSISKRISQGDEAADQALHAVLAKLSERETLAVTRAFTLFLNLANIAEQYHRVRRRRWYLRQADASHQRGSLKHFFQQASDQNIDHKALLPLLETLNIELVLTAHPTEVMRRSIMHKYDAISRELALLDNATLTPDERDESLLRIQREILATWQTNEIRQQRPTPLDEARWGLAIVETTLWDVVPRYLKALRREYRAYSGSPLPETIMPIRFGSWMGGDRDGNPNVTPEITNRVLWMARWSAANLYLGEINQLIKTLCLSHAGKPLRDVVGDTHEPYRVLLRRVRALLENTREEAAAKMNSHEFRGGETLTRRDDLLTPLKLCYESLMSTGAGIIAEGDLQAMIDRVVCFGVHLLPLDIRQDAEKHREVLSQITSALEMGDYQSWDEKEKIKFLLTELGSKRPLIPDAVKQRKDLHDVLGIFDVIAAHPADAFGAYVISMASKPSDVLAVLLLQKAAGIETMLPVVPLFETLADLEGAADCLSELIQIPWYREFIQDHQQIMIGYSDSAKDAGMIAASWAQYRAQEALVGVADAHDIALTLFHGRGGTLGRGGAPAHQAIRSQPPGSVNGSMRVTEQGEVLRYKYGHPDIAQRNLELYTTATLEAQLFPNQPPKPVWRDVMGLLSEKSLQVYRNTVWKDPDFVEFFKRVSPEPELGALHIGSRPAKRHQQGGLASLRAIPWIFAWTQNRLMLPTWLGVGEALAEAENDAHGSVLKEMCEDWPYFRSVMGMVEMILAKAEPRVTRHYIQHLATTDMKAMGARFLESFEGTAAQIKHVLGHETLLEDMPVIQRSIQVRNPYVFPLHWIQTRLLQRLRDHEEKTDSLGYKALLISITGIAAGMRNTG